MKKRPRAALPDIDPAALELANQRDKAARATLGRRAARPTVVGRAARPTRVKHAPWSMVVPEDNPLRIVVTQELTAGPKSMIELQAAVSRRGLTASAAEVFEEMWILGSMPVVNTVAEHALCSFLAANCDRIAKSGCELWNINDPVLDSLKWRAPTPALVEPKDWPTSKAYPHPCEDGFADRWERAVNSVLILKSRAFPDHVFFDEGMPTPIKKSATAAAPAPAKAPAATCRAFGTVTPPAKGAK